jgi:predicted nicotinamide N-methyase
MTALTENIEPVDDIISLEGFFINEEYVKFDFYFGDPNLSLENEQEREERASKTHSLLASSQCCTDWDLTGQIIWPAAFQLSFFIQSDQFRPFFTDKKVVELGSGAGLSGFVAARYAERVLLTDGNEIVMRLLDKNVEYVPSSSSQRCCPVAAERLYWGERDAVDSLVAKHGVPDVLCGADIIMWPNFVLTLVQTISYWFAHNPNMQCYVSYVVRAHSTTRLLYDNADKLGLNIIRIEPKTFLPPDEWQPEGLKTVEKYMLKISLNK